MAVGIVLPSLIGVPRLPDAASRLHALVLQRAGVPFAWGANDCVLWPADAVAAQLGQDPAMQLRGRYRTQLGAHRVIARFGGLAAMATTVLGAPLQAPLLASVGDVGLLRQGALAVCGGGTWLVVTALGLGHVDLQDAAMAWRVG